MQGSSLTRKSPLLIALALAFAGACADPAGDPDDISQAGSAAQDDDAPYDDEDDASVAEPSNGQATPDAGTGAGNTADAAPGTRDAGASGGNDSGGGDAGREPISSDAGRGRADAGAATSDAGVKSDAGASGGACGTLTYANFGMQFMTANCTGCHTGASAKHGVQLDTLAGVQMNKAAVKQQTVTGTAMPPRDPTKLSAADREKLGQWLDCGAK